MISVASFARPPVRLISRTVYASLSAGVPSPGDGGTHNGTLGDAIRATTIKSGKQIRVA